MTTNKPEVFTFNSLSEECVRLSDYETLQDELADMERDYLVIIEAQDAEHRKQLDRLQAECEKLRSLLRHAQPIIRAHAGASHMLDGFRPKRNQWDELIEDIDAAIQEASP